MRPTEATKHAQAVQAARRMVARGERPGYRLVKLPDGQRAADGLPRLAVTATTARDAADFLRTAIAEALEVRPDTFDMAT